MSRNGSAEKKTTDLDLTGIGAYEDLMRKLEQRIDPLGVMTSILNAQVAWMMHPQELARAIRGMSGDVLALQTHHMRRALAMSSPDVIKPHADDARFADPAWSEVPTWDIIKESYLSFTHRLEDMLFETPGLSDKERRRAAFWVRKWLNAMAPTNFFFTNPVAIRKSIESRGESLKEGFKNLMRDVKAKNILMVEPDAFKVGVDLATTPGQVVFRNRLVELIHYTATTDKVHKTPIVIVTPWINKFYILDLTPKKSMVKYLTDQGYSVFITSWKNPTAEMADVGFLRHVELGENVVIACNRIDFRGDLGFGQGIGDRVGLPHLALDLNEEGHHRCFSRQAAPVGGGIVFRSAIEPNPAAVARRLAATDASRYSRW